MNLYILISFMTAAFSFSLIIFSLYNRPFREATGSFTFLSAVVFLNSVYIIFTLGSGNFRDSLTWAYFMEITTLVFPLLFFDFINRFVGNRLSRIKLMYKLAFLILPLGIFIYLLAGRIIQVKKFSFGYMPHYDEQVLIGIFYLVPIYLIINIILFNRIYKNYKENKYNRNIIFIACGFLVFLLINVVYRPLGLTGVIRVIPASSILNLALFLFIAVALLNSRYNIQNITLKRVFENVDDCIMVTDSEGKINQINRCLYKKIFSEKEMMFTDRDKLIKETLLSYAKNSEDFEKFLIKLEDNRVKNFRTDLNFIMNKTEKIFDTVISPVNDRGGNLIGKLTIFRDVTSNRFYQEELRNQSWVDYLTGAYNIRYIFERLGEKIRRYERYNEPFCVLLTDIDSFKKYNDTFGHLEGDKLLKGIVNIFKSNTREYIDVVGRYGGDEFVIIFSRIKIDKARDMAERILNKLNQKSIEFISLSMGIYEYKDESSIDELLKKVDDLMYKAKKSGGNRLAYN